MGCAPSYPKTPDVELAQGTFRLSSSQIGTIFGVFREVDEDGSGEIDATEFHRLFQDSRSVFLTHLFRIMDVNNDGVLVFAEFIHVVATFCLYNELDMLEFAFHAFDANSDGVIDMDEFHTFVTAMAQEQSGGATSEFPQAARRAMEMFDVDGDGTIDISEFQQIHKRFPHLLWPLFRLQYHVQETTLGMEFWKKHRVDLILGTYGDAAAAGCFCCKSGANAYRVPVHAGINPETQTLDAVLDANRQEARIDLERREREEQLRAKQKGQSQQFTSNEATGEAPPESHRPKLSMMTSSAGIKTAAFDVSTLHLGEEDNESVPVKGEHERKPSLSLSSHGTPRKKSIAMSKHSARRRPSRAEGSSRRQSPSHSDASTPRRKMSLVPQPVSPAVSDEEIPALSHVPTQGLVHRNSNKVRKLKGRKSSSAMQPPKRTTSNTSWASQASLASDASMQSGVGSSGGGMAEWAAGGGGGEHGAGGGAAGGDAASPRLVGAGSGGRGSVQSQAHAAPGLSKASSAPPKTKGLHKRQESKYRVMVSNDAVGGGGDSASAPAHNRSSSGAEQGSLNVETRRGHHRAGSSSRSPSISGSSGVSSRSPSRTPSFTSYTSSASRRRSGRSRSPSVASQLDSARSNTSAIGFASIAGAMPAIMRMAHKRHSKTKTKHQRARSAYAAGAEDPRQAYRARRRNSEYEWGSQHVLSPHPEDGYTSHRSMSRSRSRSRSRSHHSRSSSRDHGGRGGHRDDYDRDYDRDYERPSRRDDGGTSSRTSRRHRSHRRHKSRSHRRHHSRHRSGHRSRRHREDSYSSSEDYTASSEEDDDERERRRRKKKKKKAKKKRSKRSKKKSKRRKGKRKKSRKDDDDGSSGSGSDSDGSAGSPSPNEQPQIPGQVT